MEEHSRVDRFVDIAGVVLISVAAVLTALSGFQSGRWSGAQARFYNLANASRIESAEAADRGLALTAIDVNLFLHYIDAVEAGNPREAEFVNKRLRPEMRAAMNAWLATRPFTNPKAPSSPFVMPQYSLRARGASRRDTTLASTNFNAALDANRHADEFLLLTVIFAAVSFLAGVSTKMTYPRHAVVIALGMVALIYGIVRLVALPFL
ncbi:MAG: hypothetical protein WBW87_09940 [Candidatus Cybelea sp.]